MDLILLTNTNVLDDLDKALSRKNSGEYVIVTTSKYGKLVNAFFRKKHGDINIYVLKNKPIVEEKILKLIVDVKPDVIVDCDPGNELIIVKNFVKNMFVDKISCLEYLSTSL